ncbi:pyridine nucleotide-disulfide oxidoreductase [Salinibacterium sp. dk2585]|uniref:FAD-dependent oxidoreductase n=1 Tax=unclassified Salinibacterium TaxID=2632331 RepID=UPI0011C2443E|nr:MULTISPECIES: FAD-dependent oxidoreductase [unclassified Salinibacterium]QEE60543.1 pyridine nucleotide-disulfide oxidoreductase [Salinibacterium sp. dk2585]TXK55615.1 pyridine nucleotide-disulfide oxidoreductase [Salinibacterium sp. dk5596]
MSQQRIVIVGGVAGGMSCAARARRLDENAEIVVLERGDEVSFANCGLPYYVGGEIESRDALLVQTPESLRAALGLDVRVRHDVIALDTEARQVTVRTAEGTSTIDYDALVLSPGARAVRPPLPGLDSPRVRTLRTVGDAISLRERVEAGAKRAVVLGAGFIGVEAAEALRMQGLEVDVIELAPHILPPLEAELASLIRDEMARGGITVREGVGAESVEPGDAHDTVVLSDGARIPADIIVLSVGVRPDTEAFEAAGLEVERGAIVVDEHGRTSAPGVWAVGDAVVSTDAVTGIRRPVALAGPANRAGRLVADDILRPGAARPIPAPLGTAIVRMGELTAAMTGANRSSLEQAGIEFETLHLHPNQHAGYFPGAQQVHLIVHFAPGDGRLLGAQAVGADGVDKRIDVLATALRAGMAVDDLIDLDLSYSPPYGQAKDPVNLAGMAGENLLNGTLSLWHAAELESVTSEALVLDVRSRAEFASGHIPGSLNTPHTELRDRMQEVRDAAAGRPVRALCASGVRSNIAHRQLVQAGLDSATLSGGILTLKAALPHGGRDILTTQGAES